MKGEQRMSSMWHHFSVPQISKHLHLQLLRLQTLLLGEHWGESWQNSFKVQLKTAFQAEKQKIIPSTLIDAVWDFFFHEQSVLDAFI